MDNQIPHELEFQHYMEAELQVILKEQILLMKEYRQSKKNGNDLSEKNANDLLEDIDSPEKRRLGLLKIFSDYMTSEKGSSIMYYAKLLLGKMEQDDFKPHCITDKLYEGFGNDKLNDLYAIIHPFSISTQTQEIGTMVAIMSQEIFDMNDIYMWWYAWRHENELSIQKYGQWKLPISESVIESHKLKNANKDSLRNDVRMEIEKIFDRFVQNDSEENKNMIIQMRFIYEGGRECDIVRWPIEWDKNGTNPRMQFLSQNYHQYDGIILHDAVKRGYIQYMKKEFPEMEINVPKHPIIVQITVFDPTLYINYMKESDEKYGPYYANFWPKQ